MTEQTKKPVKEIAAMFDQTEGDWDDLIVRHLEYLSFYHTSPVGYYNLGFAFAHRGHAKNAEIAFKKALELRPGMAEALINLGGLAFGRCDWDEAIEYNRKAVEINPTLVNAEANIGYALLMKGEHNQAVELFEKVLETAPDFAAAHYGLAVVHYELDNLELSRKYLARAVELGHEPEKSFLDKIEKS